MVKTRVEDGADEVEGVVVVVVVLPVPVVVDSLVVVDVVVVFVRKGLISSQ